jgi:non-heme Fe2+,alpha-ketoglutarate-dependent halogenase
MHAFLPLVAQVAAHYAIVDRVSSVLGPDIIVWGASISTARPTQQHRWHVDVEHARWPGVTVFVALENVSDKSTLKVISGSHRFPLLPQEVGELRDKDVIALGRTLNPSAQLTSVLLRPGEFFIFDGKLWHGSRNMSWRKRSALLIQYCRPDARVAIPLTFDEPVLWHPHRPPCLLVKGQDRFGINLLIQSPAAQRRF